MSQSQDNSGRVLRIDQVVERTGLAKPTIYRRLGKGEFPRPIRIGERAVGWLQGEIDGYISSRERA